MACHFQVSFFTSEGPLHAALLCVTPLLPCVDLPHQGVMLPDAAIQALTMQGADFDLCHIQPTGMLGGIVEHHTRE